MSETLPFLSLVKTFAIRLHENLDEKEMIKFKV